MDFEQLFLKYKEEFTEENKKLGKEKAYKSILYKIRCLFYAIGKDKRANALQMFFLRANLFLDKTFQKKNLSSEVRNAFSKQEIGENRKKMALLNQYALLKSYDNLVLSFNDLLISYYKNISSNVVHMTILEVLIEITIDSFSQDKIEYAEYFQQIDQDLENEKIPSLQHIGTYENLKDFILQVLSNYEFFDFKEFQRSLLKKEL